MTVVVGLVEPALNVAILLADSRLTASDATKEHHYDVCQKVAQLGTEGLFGFSGPVELAETVAQAIAKTYQQLGSMWLFSEDAVMGLLRDIGVLHSQSRVSFIVAVMDQYVRGSSERPKVRLIRFSSDGDYDVTSLGIKMIGSGSQVESAIAPRLADFIQFGGLERSDRVIRQKAMFLAETILRECLNQGITSVGGLMQIHCVAAEGLFEFPYDRWVDLDDEHGTYVTMDIDDNGRWVQVHEPTGLRIPLRFPGEPDFPLPPGATGCNFAIEKLLTPISPGVERSPRVGDVLRVVEIFRPPHNNAWITRIP